MSRYFDNGQYNLTKLLLKTNTSQKVEVDLRPAMYDMTLYETIYKETLSGNLTIIESSNIVREYSLGNRETIEIEFNTAGVDKTTKMKAVVYKVGEPQRVSDHATGHTIYFMSEEALNSVRKKTFWGATDVISSLVTRLYDGIKRAVDPKPLEVSPTMLIQSYVFTGNEALDAIHMVSSKAMSASGNRGYVFYEDFDKFNFKPLEELYQQDPVVEYAYKNSGVYNDVKNRAAEAFNAYQDYEVLPAANMAQRLTDGLYGSSWANFSINQKFIAIENYDAKKDFDQSKSLGKSPLPIDNDYNDAYSDRLFLSYSCSTDEAHQPMVLNKMTKARSSAFSVSIGVFGDSTLRVGQTCKANIPNWSSNGMQPSGADRDVLTGKFLIAEIKHQFTQKLYTQRIKIVKDAYEEITA